MYRQRTHLIKNRPYCRWDSTPGCLFPSLEALVKITCLIVTVHSLFCQDHRCMLGRGSNLKKGDYGAVAVGTL